MQLEKKKYPMFLSNDINLISKLNLNKTCMSPVGGGFGVWACFPLPRKEL